VRKAILCCLLACLIGACSGSSADQSAPATSSPLPAYAPKLEPRACDYSPPLRTKVTCSWLVVPEDRTRPDGQQVKLAVAFLHSKAARPLPDPIVYVHGGPGGDAVAGAHNGWDRDSRLPKRDIVLFDQRGSGLSQPSLNCPEIEEAIRRRFAAVDPLADELAARVDATRRCRDRLAASGVDLGQYNTRASAADMDDLRRALGIAQWNLVGVSYGTRLALESMRSYPAGVRSVVLDSAYPPTVGGLEPIIAGGERAFDQLVAGCEASSACDAMYGDLDALITDAFDALNQQPFRGSVDLGPDAGGRIQLAVEGTDLIGGVYTALYDASLIPVLPRALEAIARHDYGIINALAQQAIPFATSQSEGAYLSVDCADSQAVDPERTARILRDSGRFAIVVAESAPPYCEVWNVPSARGFNEPVVSDIPTLVLAGTYDPVTPPQNGKDAVATLPNSTYVEIDGVGHAVLFSNPCSSAIYRSFLESPDNPETDCAKEQPPPAFG
jgi:pimeloyl-ACP methyl ester carboxylesterase